MVRIGATKYNNHLIIWLLLISMLLQTLTPLTFNVMASPTFDDCIRMEENVEGVSFYRIDNSRVFESFGLNMDFEISSDNTDGNNPVIVKNIVDSRLKILNAQLFDMEDNKIGDAIINNQTVTLELLPENKEVWIDKELRLTVMVKPNNMVFGEIVENDFTINFDNKLYTSNTVQIVLVKEPDLQIEKTGEIQDNGNTLVYQVSHKIIDEQELKNLGYNLENTEIVEYKFEDTHLVIGSAGLYSYENISITSSGVDLTSNPGVTLNVDDSNGKFTVSYSESFVKDFLGETININYELKTNLLLSKEDLTERLMTFGFSTDGIVNVVNNAIVNMELKHDTGLEETFVSNKDHTLILDEIKTQDLIATKVWHDTGTYFNQNVNNVEIILNANETEIDRVIVDAAMNWEYVFTDLPIRDTDNKVIKYTLSEGAITYSSGLPGNYVYSSSPKTGGLNLVNKWSSPSLSLTKEVTQVDNNNFENKKIFDLEDREAKYILEFEIPTEERLAPFRHYKYVLEDFLDGLGVMEMNDTSLEVEINGVDILSEIDYDFNVDKDTLIIEFPETLLNNNQGETVTVKYKANVKDDYIDLSDEEFEEVLVSVGKKEMRNSALLFEYYRTSNIAPDNHYKVSSIRSSITYDKYYTDIDISVKKEWIGHPLDEVTVALKANNVIVEEVTLNKNNDWTHIFENYPERDDDKNIINYEVEEELLVGYTTEIKGDIYDGFVITNIETITPNFLNIPVTKKWKGTVLPFAEVYLLANGEIYQSTKLSKANSWTHIFANLPDIEADTHLPIEYTIKEKEYDNYDTKIEGNISDGFVITNTKISTLPLNCEFIFHESPVSPDKTTITFPIDKYWIGDPGEEVEINLFADNEKIDTFLLNENNDWHILVENLPKQNSSGENISYTIDEVEVEGYTTSIEGSMNTGFVVTNTQIIPEEATSISVEKLWIGQKQPQAEIILVKNNEKIDSVILNEANNWKYVFDNLEVYHKDDDNNLVKNNYKIEEIPIENYSAVIKQVDNNFTIINIETGEDLPSEYKYYKFVVNKEWIGKKLNEAKVQILNEGKVSSEFTLNEDNNWKFEVEDLPIYNDNFDYIKYEIKELPIPGYESEISGDFINGINIRNTELTSEPSKPGNKKQIQVNKLWIGGQESQTIVSLVTDNKKIIETVTLNSKNNWSHTFEVDNDNNNTEYSIIEYNVPGYDTEITGNAEEGFLIKNIKSTIVNPVDPTKTILRIRKEWQGKKLDTISTALIANSKIMNVATLNEDNNWTHIFYDLDKFDKFGNEIEYSILEFGAKNYEVEIKNETNTDFVIINKEIRNNGGGNSSGSGGLPVNPPLNLKTYIDVSAVWIGGEGNKLTVNLMADNSKVNSISLMPNKNWKDSFLDLPIYRNGKEIEYTLGEITVSGYDVEIKGSTKTGYTIILTKTDDKKIEPGDLRNMLVKKSWVGSPADQVEVILYGDEKEVDRAILNPDNNWEHTFKDLPIITHKDAVDAIDYYVEEVDIEGYESEIKYLFDYGSDNLKEFVGYNITNYKIQPEKKHTNIHVRKSWVGRMRSNVTINLLIGEEIIDTVILNENNNWEHTFRDLARIDENDRIVRYKIAEEPIKGYVDKIIKVEEDAYLVINEEVGYTGDGNANIDGRPNIKDVQTYDPGITASMTILTLAVLLYIIIENKKKEF